MSVLEVAPHAAFAYPLSSMIDSNPGLVATSFALLLLIGLPVMAAVDARRGVDLEAAGRHRRALYASVALSLSMITSLTLIVIAWQNITARSLGWQVDEATPAFAWGLAFAAIGLAATWGITTVARRAGLGESPLAMLLMPRDAGEKRAFLLLSGVAAVCEELLFRGFLLWILTGWLRSPWFAAAVVALSFGLSHGYQKLAGILRAGVLPAPGCPDGSHGESLSRDPRALLDQRGGGTGRMAVSSRRCREPRIARKAAG